MPGIFDGIADVKYLQRSRCGVAQLKDQLDPEDSAALLRVLERTSVPVPAIRDRLISAGYDISKDTLRRHRKSDCKCQREAKK